MQTIAASEITPEKRQDFMIYTGTRLIDHHDADLFVSNNSPAVDCFEDMSPFAASNFDSPLAAQTEEAENGSEWHFCTTSCSVQLQFGNVSTTDGV